MRGTRELVRSALCPDTAAPVALLRAHTPGAPPLAEVRKKFYKEAAMLYSTGLDVKCNDATLNSQLAGNRAHVHTLLGNYRKAINDADLALSHDPKAVKAAFRGAKAALNIPDFAAADRFCVQGLQLEPDNEELQALGKKAAAAKEAEEAAKREAEARLAAGLALADAIQKDRGLTVGTAQFDGGNRTPALANDGSMVWPVTLLYPQSMSSDIIQAFPETDTFGPHLDVMFGEGAPPLEWDTQGEYTRARVELYWARRAGAKGLTRQQLAEVLLHNGVPGEDAPDPREADGNFVEWVRVEEGSTLKDLLAQKVSARASARAHASCTQASRALARASARCHRHCALASTGRALTRRPAFCPLGVACCRATSSAASTRASSAWRAAARPSASFCTRPVRRWREAVQLRAWLSS